MGGMSGVDPDLEARINEALDAGDVNRAATTGLRGYGPQILGYLTAVLREHDLAEDALFPSSPRTSGRGLPVSAAARPFGPGPTSSRTTRRCGSFVIRSIAAG